MGERLVPAAQAAELFYFRMRDEDFLLDAVERMVDGGFYRAAGIGVLERPESLRRARRLSERGFRLTSWTTFYMTERGLCLHAADPALRKRSVRAALELAHRAAEGGVGDLAFVSGDDPGEAERHAATARLFESLEQICREMRRYPGMHLLLEPLDRGAHKNQLIGPTDEAAALVGALNRIHGNAFLVWDSAHIALNREDLAESLGRFGALTAQIHLSNAVLDPADPRYGDHHMLCREPGFLTDETAAELLKKAAGLPRGAAGEVYVAMESRTLPGGDPVENERVLRAFLLRALEAAGAGCPG